MKKVTDACIGLLFAIALFAFSGIDGDCSKICAIVGFASLVAAGAVSIFRVNGGDAYDTE